MKKPSKGITYNKLVRDLIPEIIERNGDRAEVRILDQIEYLKALRAKLLEEAKELADAPDVESITNELIDCYEILAAFEKAYGLRHSTLIDLQERKRRDRGGFTKRVFLIRTEAVSDDDSD
jgi:predicted house-cleaning noncanonical NTP pyrophosphatase (MazG superfamily)